MRLRNRIVRSATLEALGTADGTPTAKLVDLYRQLATGGCGLLISGVVPVLPRNAGEMTWFSGQTAKQSMQSSQAARLGALTRNIALVPIRP